MEPTTLTTAAIVIWVFSEAFKEVGKTLGIKTVEAGGKLARLLREKRPETAKTLAAGEDAPDYETAVVEAGTLAQQDTEVAAAVRAVVEAMQAQPQGQQIVNSFVQKAANVYNAPVTIESQNITL